MERPSAISMPFIATAAAKRWILTTAFLWLAASGTYAIQVRNITKENVVLATLATPAITHYSQYTRQINNIYAARHGYEYRYMELDESAVAEPYAAASWHKLPFVRAILDDPDVDAVFWIDADAIVHDHRRTLEDFLHQYPDKDVILSADSADENQLVDPEGQRIAVNFGVWFVRNTRWARELLQILWDSSEPSGFHRRHPWEQEGLHILWYGGGKGTTDSATTQKRPDLRFKEHIAILPSTAINTPSQLGAIEAHTPTSFVFHCAALSGSIREAVFKSMAAAWGRKLEKAKATSLVPSSSNLLFSSRWMKQEIVRQFKTTAYGLDAATANRNGVALYSADMYEEAASLFRKAADLYEASLNGSVSKPDISSILGAYTNMGITYENLKMEKEQAAAFSRALEILIEWNTRNNGKPILAIDMWNVHQLTSMARAFYAVGNMAGGEWAARTAVEAQPSSPSAHFILAQFLSSAVGLPRVYLERPREALEHINVALELSPQTQHYLKAKKNLLIALREEENIGEET